MKKFLYSIASLIVLGSCAGGGSTAGTDVDAAVAAVDNVIMTRRSIRQYTDQEISRETLQAIADAGINAPNGQGRQAYEVRIVRDPQPGGEGPQFRGLFKGAPYVAFIAADTSYDMSHVDCGLLGENMILAAWARGIGSCCLAQPVRLMKGTPECRPFLNSLDFSEGYELLYCIAFGYPAEEPDARPRKAEKVRIIE